MISPVGRQLIDFSAATYEKYGLNSVGIFGYRFWKWAVIKSRRRVEHTGDVEKIIMLNFILKWHVLMHFKVIILHFTCYCMSTLIFLAILVSVTQ